MEIVSFLNIMEQKVIGDFSVTFHRSSVRQHPSQTQVCNLISTAPSRKLLVHHERVLVPRPFVAI